MMLATGPWAMLAVAAATGAGALAVSGSDPGQRAAEGHRLAAVVIACCVAAAVAARAQPWLARALRRRSPPAPGARGGGAAVVIGVVVALAVSGGPSALVDRVERSFSTPPSPLQGHLDRRLFTLYGEGRAGVWRVAWDAAASHPVAGIGAGSFEQRWLQERPVPQGFRDAHNLYLETLAELGVVGLGLLGVVLAAPAVALRRVREHPLAPAATGALAAYLAHAALDWDWEMPAVTVAGLGCACALVALARDERARTWRVRARIAGVTAAAALSAVALIGLVANGAIGASIRALQTGDYATAERTAAKAADWEPWSPEPWRWKGEAQLAAGDEAAARRSFAAALEREPRDWALWYGVALASHGPPRRRALARAAALNPLSNEVRSLTGR
jgi:hypothetical protein